MGGGRWNVGTYRDTTGARIASGGPAFTYDDTLRRSTPPSAWKVHVDLDPSRLNTFGVNVREARNSDEHPNSTPIAVFFDVTASMGAIPGVLQRKLPQLHGLLQRKGYVEDPQILFGAIGDATSDRVPLQIGQFESDNRMDGQLEHLFLEGGGGGGNHESYELGAYFLARHTELDCLQQGKKGYAFFIGDERVYAKVVRQQVERIIGDKLPGDLTTVEIFEELKRKFEVFFLFAAQGSYNPEQVLFNNGYDQDGGVCYWRDLVGQNALILDEAEAVCETIALTLGVMEGVISLNEGLDDLRDVGATRASITAAGKALARIDGGAAAARTTGKLPNIPDGGTTGTTRL